MKAYTKRSIKLIFFLFLLFLLISERALPQTSQYAKQDSLSAQIKVLLSRNQWKDAITLTGNYISHAYEKQDQHGVAFGYDAIGNIYSLHDQYKEALNFLNKATTEKGNLVEPDLDTRLASDYAIVYNELGLKDKAKIYQDQAFASAKNITDPQIRSKAIAYLYAIKAELYESKMQNDSALFCLRYVYAVKPEPNASARIARYFLNNSINLDSALLYLQKADSLYRKGNYPPYYKGIIDRFYGDLYDQKGEYDKAISSYLTAIDTFSVEKRIGNLQQCYKRLSQVYQKKNNNPKSQEYLEKYTAISDSLTNTKMEALAISVEDIENQYVRQYMHVRQRNRWMIGTIAFVCVIILLLLFQRFSRKQRRTSILLEQKEEETSILQKKINSTFDDLVELAKLNDPNFYTRFREVYPDLHLKLSQIATDLTLPELTLCAYIYLNFQTKEIAEYTFKSVRTIQNGKYSIRKKLNITSDTDVYLWLKNLNS
ncbi:MULTISPECIES: tetratricopeptide repeat protein [Chitinophagaceae]